MTNADSLDTARQAIGVYGAVQDEWELAGLLDVLAARQPKLILEIGSWSGGTLWAWAQTGADVITVTLEDHANILRDHGAQVLLADSRQCKTRLTALLAGRVPDFVFIDGDHSWGTCKKDWTLAQEVAPGAVVAFHDINCPGEPGPARVFNDAALNHPSMTIISPAASKGTGLIFT